MKRLEGQTALVTGANSGIGAAIARALAAAGANVGINYVANEERARQLAQDVVNSGGKALALKADVSREDDVTGMFETLISTYGTVDILMSNAGIQKDAPFASTSLDQWHAVLDVNLTGAFLCAREAAREFLRRGVVMERSAAAGKIIFTSSVHQEIPWTGHANYASSKGGLQMLMKTIAQELAPKKVRVNCIAPGAIKTPINESAWNTPEAGEALEQLIPYGRIGETKDIGPVAAWLASDEADYITGTTIFVDGGMMLYPGFQTGG
jgi:glucose 1-dehydrogenase